MAGSPTGTSSLLLRQRGAKSIGNALPTKLHTQRRIRSECSFRRALALFAAAKPEAMSMIVRFRCCFDARFSLATKKLSFNSAGGALGLQQRHPPSGRGIGRGCLPTFGVLVPQHKAKNFLFDENEGEFHVQRGAEPQPRLVPFGKAL